MATACGDYGGGSSFGGSTYVTGFPGTMYTGTSSSGSAMLYPFYNNLTPKQLEEQRKQREKDMSEAEKQRQKEMNEWNLSKLDPEKKLSIMKIAKDLLNQYHREQEVKKLMSGVKWFLFFLGLAILINFGRILDLLKIVVKH